MRNHEYEVNELVVGANLSALLYAYNAQIPVLFSSPSPPHLFERFAEGTDTSTFGIPKESKVFKYPEKETTEGNPKLELWNKMIFDLGICGLVPLSSGVESMRIGEDQTLRVFTKTRSFTYRYNTLRVFELDQISGLNTVRSEKNKVLDWINIRAALNSDLDRLTGEGDFLSELYFYTSQRNGAQSTVKDCIAVSYLTDKELQEVEFSDTYVRFGVRAMMEKAGIKGPANGKHWHSGKPVWSRPKVEPAKREIFRETVLEAATSLPDGVIYDKRKEEEIIQCLDQIITDTLPASYLSQVSRLTSRL